MDAREYVADAKAKVLRAMSVEESVREFVELYEAFAQQLEETEPLYRPARLRYLHELQEKLRRAGQREHHHGTSL